jgi:hypothetical protein
MFYVHWNTIVRKIKIHRGIVGLARRAQECTKDEFHPVAGPRMIG